MVCAMMAHNIAWTHAEGPVKLMSGQLTWAIDPGFAYSTREVTFTLLTAFEMDPSCKYTGEVVNCSGSASTTGHGRLCVDQFEMFSTPFDDGTFSQVRIGAACSHSTANDFHIVSTRHINGLNIVFGKTVHTVQAENNTISMLAYFKSSHTPVLPQCELNITDTALPCAMNVEDLDNPQAPQYKLRRISGFATDSQFNVQEKYWQGGAYTFPALDAQNAPFFETYVRVCPQSGAQNCKSPEVSLGLETLVVFFRFCWMGARWQGAPRRSCREPSGRSQQGCAATERLGARRQGAAARHPKFRIPVAAFSHCMVFGGFHRVFWACGGKGAWVRGK